MKLHPPRTARWVADFLKAKLSGDPAILISGINEIHRVEEGDIAFVDHPKYFDKTLGSEASAILINKDVQCPDGKALIISDDPFNDFNRLIKYFYSRPVSEKAISESSRTGEGTVIRPNVFIGENVEIGKNCMIHANVTIYENCTIGDHVTIHSGSVIGADGFYYRKRQETGKYDQFHSCGTVVIGDRVDVGACCTIDRGVTHRTVIGEGTKLDNLIQVGHDTVIGKNCLLAAQVGLAGMVTLEDDVVLWGQVGVISNVVIGKGAVVLAQSGVSKSLPGNTVYFGSPAGEARQKMKELAKLRRLPETVVKLI